ncbi:DegQ family serine endoprotease [Pseudaminobacter soli (ex Li et al. 2025)]|uniref:Probable periplasmic serine endoprotease DegP-like n=1 Tax=Pseudaminobacter soli (ex Li et al. 2025) TaxID=1295366 RepID=A0A2P7SML8_9HYPH|nr:DegQ family serine endoprotease [Mesorhizobium soli]PSJ63722.1 serine protease [Mesorhizobium soli]
MTAKFILPRLRNGFAAATAALLVGAIAMPHAVVAPAMAQETQQKPAIHPQGPASVADLAEGLLGAVVNISTSQTVKGGEGPNAVPMPQLPEGSPFQDFFDDFFKNRRGDKGGGGDEGEGGGGDARPQKVQSLGSGFIVDADKGIIVTNNHVIADADEIIVNFSDGTKLKATLVGTDTKTDIAVLKVDPKGKKLTAVKFGDSNKMRIGDWVMAVGNPFGLGGTVTIGIVSARNRDINSGPYDDFIQTDAAINRGNSGGPLFNMEGEVVGINTAIISPSGGSIGIGFSIPSELAAGVVQQLAEYGETRRGWLGVRIQPVTDEIAESLGMKATQGALVAGVIKGGPVDNGTIQPGDVITKFDGKDVHEMRDLPRVVAESPVGKDVDVVLVRKGVEQTVKVKLGRLEDGEKLAKGEEAKKTPDKAVTTTSVLGMTIGDLDDGARSKFGIGAEVAGVVITEVSPNSPAADRGIAPGEVITEIAQEQVSSPKDVTDKIKALKEQGRKNALLMLASKTGELRFVTVRID